MAKRLITEQDIQQAAAQGRRAVAVPPDQCIVTPMARDAADALGITLEEVGAGAAVASTPAGSAPEVTGLVQEVVSRLRSRLPADVSPDRLEAVVREVVTTRLANAAAIRPAAVTAAGAGGLRLISGRQAMAPSSAPVHEQGQVQLSEVLSAGTAGGLSAGFLAWENASFRRRVETHEIDIVIDGELQVTVDDETVTGGPGDMVVLPAGVEAVYHAPSAVRLVCVNRA